MVLLFLEFNFNQLSSHTKSLRTQLESVVIVVIALQVKISQQYLFGKKDTTEKGEPLGKIIEKVTSKNYLLLFLPCILTFILTKKSN